jgi:hypothetical protein
MPGNVFDRRVSIKLISFLLLTVFGKIPHPFQINVTHTISHENKGQKLGKSVRFML